VEKVCERQFGEERQNTGQQLIERGKTISSSALASPPGRSRRPGDARVYHATFGVSMDDGENLCRCREDNFRSQPNTLPAETSFTSTDGRKKVCASDQRHNKVRRACVATGARSGIVPVTRGYDFSRHH
jgi:hypothetical protein